MSFVLTSNQAGPDSPSLSSRLPASHGARVTWLSIVVFTTSAATEFPGRNPVRRIPKTEEQDIDHIVQMPGLRIESACAD